MAEPSAGPAFGGPAFGGPVSGGPASGGPSSSGPVPGGRPGDELAAEAVELAGSLERELAALEAALGRLEDGTYGHCLVCGRLLDDAALDGDPTATRCGEHSPAARPPAGPEAATGPAQAAAPGLPAGPEQAAGAG